MLISENQKLSVLSELEKYGIYAALDLLKTFDGVEKDYRMFGVWCVNQIKHLLSDQRSIHALEMSEKFANGIASEEELSLACEDAKKAGLSAWMEWDKCRNNQDAKQATKALSTFNASVAAVNASRVTPEPGIAVKDVRIAVEENWKDLADNQTVMFIKMLNNQASWQGDSNG
jgi:hypothetical protein